jgi:hypothetical protein
MGKRVSTKRLPVVLAVLAVLFIIGIADSGKSSTSTATGPAPAPAPAQELAAAPEAPPAPTGPVTSFSDGTYVVGTDIVAGTYHTTGPASNGSGLCYWEREKDTSGNFDSIIANDLGHGPATVTISSSDGAFKTSGCNTWTKVD